MFIYALHPQMHVNVCIYIYMYTHRYLLHVVCHYIYSITDNSKIVIICNFYISESMNYDKNMRDYFHWENEQHRDKLLQAAARSSPSPGTLEPSRTPCWHRSCLLWTRSVDRIRARRKNCSAEVSEAIEAIS